MRQAARTAKRTSSGLGPKHGEVILPGVTSVWSSCGSSLVGLTPNDLEVDVPRQPLYGTDMELLVEALPLGSSETQKMESGTPPGLPF